MCEEEQVSPFSSLPLAAIGSLSKNQTSEIKIFLFNQFLLLLIEMECISGGGWIFPFL